MPLIPEIKQKCVAKETEDLANVILYAKKCTLIGFMISSLEGKYGEIVSDFNLL